MTTLAVALIFAALGLITGLNLASARRMVDNARYELTPKGEDALGINVEDARRINRHESHLTDEQAARIFQAMRDAEVGE